MDYPEEAQLFAIPYPFVRDTYDGYFGGDELRQIPTWRPGIRFEAIGPEDSGAVADAIGKALFYVVGTFKPRGYPARVFYTRKFVDPDGREFGKRRLLIATLEKFRRLTKGYQHPFGIGEPYEGTPRMTMDQFLEELREYTEANPV